MTIAGLTAREALSRRLVLAAVLMSAAFLALYGIGLHFAAAELMTESATAIDELLRREASVQLLYMGLFTTSFLVAVTAVLAGAGTISSEIDSGVIYGVLSRPVRRGELALGKFFGVGTMLVAYAALFNGAIIALARWQIEAPVVEWPAALALLSFEAVPLLAVALLGSTRLPTLANGIMCLAVYAVGFVGALIEQIGGLIENQTMVNLGILSSLVAPLDAIHRMAVSLLLPQGLLVQAGGPPGAGAESPSSWMLVYAVGYTVVVVLLAMWSFARRDL
jgi:Cu-processing system permease protein